MYITNFLLENQANLFLSNKTHDLGEKVVKVLLISKKLKKLYVCLKDLNI